MLVLYPISLEKPKPTRTQKNLTEPQMELWPSLRNKTLEEGLGLFFLCLPSELLSLTILFFCSKSMLEIGYTIKAWLYICSVEDGADSVRVSLSPV